MAMLQPKQYEYTCQWNGKCTIHTCVLDARVDSLVGEFMLLFLLVFGSISFVYESTCIVYLMEDAETTNVAVPTRERWLIHYLWMVPAPTQSSYKRHFGVYDAQGSGAQAAEHKQRSRTLV